MQFGIRLISIWKFLTIAVILNMTLMFLTINFLHGHYLFLTLILGFPVFFGSMIIAMYISSRKKNIAIDNGILTVDNSNPIQIDQIEWYNEDKNFLLDGIRIKTKQKRNYFFSTINLYNKDPNFNIFKDILINKSLNHSIPEKTTNELDTESKFLKHASTIALIILLIFIPIAFHFDMSVDKTKLFLLSMIVIGTFISTRK